MPAKKTSPSRKKTIPVQFHTLLPVIVSKPRATETARHALLHPIHEMCPRQLAVAHLEKAKAALESAIMWMTCGDDELEDFTVFEIESTETNLQTTARHISHAVAVLNDGKPSAVDIEERRRRREAARAKNEG